MRQAIIWTNGGLAYWRMYASLILNGLIQRVDPLYFPIIEHTDT